MLKEYSLKNLEKEFEDLKNKENSKKEISNDKESYSFANIKMTRFSDGSLKKETMDGSGWVVHFVKTVQTKQGTQIEEYFRNNVRHYDTEGNMIYQLKQGNGTFSVCSGTACKSDKEKLKEKHLSLLTLFNLTGNVGEK